MSEENRQQQSSAESTVAGAAKTGKAIASIAKGAATGGAHGAAVEAAKSSKKWTIPIVAVILLSVLIIAMLPSVIFGSLLGDGTDTPNGISDDTVLVQNLADINSGISMKQMIPLKKQSKKAQKEQHAKQRGSWYGISPVTRTVPNGKAYDRNRVKREDREFTD